MKFHWKKIDFFLNVFAQNIHCGYTLEQGDSEVPTMYVLDQK